MASPDPAVVERQYYLSLLNLTDNPSLSLADLRAMSGGGASVKSAADTPTAVQNALLNPTVPVTNSLNQRYVPRPSLPLTRPYYFAHRGGAGYAPEETMEAFRISVASGVTGIEMDLQPLGDGTLAVMHDSTVDRTTDGTGNVSDYTGPSWRALNAAAKFPWNGKVVPPALFNEILGEFAGNTYLMVEPKDQNNATQLMDAADPYGIKNTLIIATSYFSVLQAAKARGYMVCFVWFGAIGVPDSLASVLAYNPDFLMLSSARPDSEITTLVNTGIPVIPFTINTRKERDRLLALGCAGFLGDQPVYLKRSTALRTIDSWRQGIWGHGTNFTNPGGGNGLSGGAISLGPASASAVIPGEVLPVANALGSYTIDIDCCFTTLPADTTRAISISFGIADDGLYGHDGGPNSFPNEYRAYIRANGQISLYRVPAGDSSGFVQLGTTVVTAALVANTFSHYRITVTPTTVKFERTDSVGVIGPITDSTYRGGYIDLSKNAVDAAAQFKNLTIS